MPEGARLAADPVNEVCPDFAAAVYAPLRDALRRENDDSEDQVIATLVEMWTQDHDARMDRWAIQQAEDDLAARERDRQQARREESQQPAGQEDAQEQLELDKKKPGLSDFDEDKPIPGTLLPRLSQYALQKLKQGEYIELLYFSSEGYRDARRDAHSTADDTFGIAKSEEVLTLRPANAVKASKSARLDHELPMVEFLRAKNAFLHHAAQEKWPKKHIDALSLFFWKLENHPMRELPNGEDVILTYASRVRRQWHDDLKAKTAGNISIISTELIQSIGFEINARRQEEAVRRQEEFLQRVSVFLSF